MNLIAPLLTLETIRLNLNVVSRKRLYEEAGLVFESSVGISHTDAFDALFAREKLGSTCVGSGCAIPHGRVSGITEPAAVFYALLLLLVLTRLTDAQSNCFCVC